MDPNFSTRSPTDDLISRVETDLADASKCSMFSIDTAGSVSQPSAGCQQTICRGLCLFVMSYADRARSPRVLTDGEQALLLRETGEHAASYRDHMLFAMALGTGLREHELVGLDVGDVTNNKGAPRVRVELRIFKRCTDDPAPQFVIVPNALRHKLRRFLSWKRERGESCDRSAPLFMSRKRRRLSTRRARALFSSWRNVCELSPKLSFHALRHTFCQNLYEMTGNIRLVQKAARHANLTTTSRYAEPSMNELVRAVAGLTC